MKHLETICALKMKNSNPPCECPHWDDDGMVCLTYVSCGDPCEKPCQLCLVWEGYGSADKAAIDCAVCIKEDQEKTLLEVPDKNACTKAVF